MARSILVIPADTQIITHDSPDNNDNVLCTMDCELETEVTEAAGRRCYTCTGQTLRVHSPNGSTFRREMTSWPPT